MAYSIFAIAVGDKRLNVGEVWLLGKCPIKLWVVDWNWISDDRLQSLHFSSISLASPMAVDNDWGFWVLFCHVKPTIWILTIEIWELYFEHLAEGLFFFLFFPNRWIRCSWHRILDDNCTGLGILGIYLVTLSI